MIILTIEIKGIATAVIILAVLGAILGALIGIMGKIFYVKPDSRVEDITKILPGANCGACGFPGCSGLAEGIVNDGVSPKNCKSLKEENVCKITEILTNFEKENSKQEN